MMKIMGISWATQLAKEYVWVSIVREQPNWQRSMCEWALCVSNSIGKGVYVWVNIVLGVFKCFGWRKRVPSNLGPPNVCLNCSTRFCGTIPIWALWLYLSSFLNLFYKTSGDCCISVFSFMVFLNYSLSSVKDLVERI
jgi:hypothetical protein